MPVYPNSLSTPVNKYAIKVLQAYLDVEYKDGGYVLNLKKKDDLYYPCRYAVGMPDASNFTNIIEIITIKFPHPLHKIPDTLEYAVGNTINKMINSHLLRLQLELSRWLKISELEAMNRILERFNIAEDEYSFESNHKAFMRYKKYNNRRVQKRYREGFKKRIVDEILSGNLSYRGAKKKYNIGSLQTLSRWVKEYG